MTPTRRELLIGFGALALSALPAGAASPELVVVGHPRVPPGELADVELEAIFLTLRRYWDGSRAIIPFNLAPGTEWRVLFDRVVLRMTPDEVGRYWLDRRVRGSAPPPRKAPDPITLVRLVARLEGAIGYAPAEVPLENVRILARIRNGKVLRP